MAKYLHIILALGFTFTVGTSTRSYASDAGKMIELIVTGDAGQAFTGECFLFQGAGKTRRHRIQGSAPTKFWLPAQSIRCFLQMRSFAGNLVLTVIRNGKTEFVQRSQIPLRVIYIASKGPWGAAEGSVSASRSGLRK